jgi:hypothetical protein
MLGVARRAVRKATNYRYSIGETVEELSFSSSVISAARQSARRPICAG